MVCLIFCFASYHPCFFRCQVRHAHGSSGKATKDEEVHVLLSTNDGTCNHFEQFQQSGMDLTLLHPFLFRAPTPAPQPSKTTSLESFATHWREGTICREKCAVHATPTATAAASTATTAAAAAARTTVVEPPTRGTNLCTTNQEATRTDAATTAVPAAAAPPLLRLHLRR